MENPQNMIDVANVNRIQKGNMDTAMAKNS